MVQSPILTLDVRHEEDEFSAMRKLYEKMVCKERENAFSILCALSILIQDMRKKEKQG